MNDNVKITDCITGEVVEVTCEEWAMMNTPMHLRPESEQVIEVEPEVNA